MFIGSEEKYENVVFLWIIKINHKEYTIFKNISLNDYAILIYLYILLTKDSGFQGVICGNVLI